MKKILIIFIFALISLITINKANALTNNDKQKNLTIITNKIYFIKLKTNKIINIYQTLSKINKTHFSKINSALSKIGKINILYRGTINSFNYNNTNIMSKNHNTKLAITIHGPILKKYSKILKIQYEATILNKEIYENFLLKYKKFTNFTSKKNPKNYNSPIITHNIILQSNSCLRLNKYALLDLIAKNNIYYLIFTKPLINNLTK